MTDTLHLPGPETQRTLRDALGRFPTGVTVVTTTGPHGPEGITVNSFASVSLDPALVLWCPACASRRHGLFCTAEHFVIHVLASDQHDLAMRFTRNGGGFAHAPDCNAEGQPVLTDTLARFDCARHAVIEAGDHSIVVGRVLRFARGPGKALVFHDGAFGATLPQGPTEL
ncbi:MAG: flavin reductase family protein [Marinibacterium sp.]